MGIPKNYTLTTPTGEDIEIIKGSTTNMYRGYAIFGEGCNGFEKNNGLTWWENYISIAKLAIDGIIDKTTFSSGTTTDFKNTLVA